ncbi:MAG: type II toxin-antitoxin system RelE/ParE family toxin [Synergistaceae bacterium]|nr:type II toxin-antitoxin system RelE/ParE family toxin [Synergistaceae bacterium]
MAVELEPLNIIYYEREDGTMPAKEFIDSTDANMHAKIDTLLDMLSERGRWLGMPYSRHLDEGIYELRVHFGSNASRILYFFVFGNSAVITNGFIKKTQKTPSAELKKAKQYRRDYLSRLHNKEKSDNNV